MRDDELSLKNLRRFPEFTGTVPDVDWRDAISHDCPSDLKLAYTAIWDCWIYMGCGLSVARTQGLQYEVMGRIFGTGTNKAAHDTMRRYGAHNPAVKDLIIADCSRYGSDDDLPDGFMGDVGL